MGLKTSTLYSFLVILQFNVLIFPIADVVHGHLIQIVFYTGTYYLFYNVKKKHATAPPPCCYIAIFKNTLAIVYSDCIAVGQTVINMQKV